MEIFYGVTILLTLAMIRLVSILVGHAPKTRFECFLITKYFVLSIEKHKKILKRKLDPKQADIIYKKLSLLFANQRIPANRLIFLHKYIIQDQLNSEETEIKKKLFPYHTDSKNIELFFNKNITLIELAKKI